jgi:methionine biosynthesis protein MetW
VSVDYEGRLYPFGNWALLAEVERLLPLGQPTVLDVGCGRGELLAHLPKGTATVGVDVSAASVDIARRFATEAYVGDLDKPIPDLDGRVFDLVVCADVLEHLIDPLAGLRRAMTWCGPGGHVVVSLPNIGYWAARWQLARGRFPREQDGIFDAGHLHFFTVDEASRLLASAGLREVELRPVIPRMQNSVSAVGRLPGRAQGSLEARWSQAWLRYPGLGAYQLIFVGAPAPTP